MIFDRAAARAFDVALDQLGLQTGHAAPDPKAKRLLFKEWLRIPAARRSSASEFLIRSLLRLDIYADRDDEIADVAAFFHALQVVSGGRGGLLPMTLLREWFTGWRLDRRTYPQTAHAFLLDRLGEDEEPVLERAPLAGYAHRYTIPLPDGRTSHFFEIEDRPEIEGSAAVAGSSGVEDRSGGARRARARHRAEPATRSRFVQVAEPRPIDDEHAEEIGRLGKRQLALRQHAAGETVWFPASLPTDDEIWREAALAPEAGHPRAWAFATWRTPFAPTRGRLHLTDRLMLFQPDVPMDDAPLFIPLDQLTLHDPPIASNGWQLRVELPSGIELEFTLDAQLLTLDQLDAFGQSVAAGWSPMSGSGIDRSGVDRSGADGSGADGSGVDGSGVDGSGVDPGRVDWGGGDRGGVDRSGVSWRGVDWRGINQRGA